MASISKDIVIDAPAGHVWDAIRDIGAIHTRLAQGFVLDTRLDGDARVVTFAGGTVVRERIIDVDDRRRRLAYSIIEGRPTYHRASFQVYADGEHRSRVVWLADLLPDDLAGPIGSMMEQGCAAMKRTLETSSAEITVQSVSGPLTQRVGP